MNIQAKFQIDYDGYPLEVSVPSWMPVNQLKELVETMERLETLSDLESQHRLALQHIKDLEAKLKKQLRLELTDG